MTDYNPSTNTTIPDVNTTDPGPAVTLDNVVLNTEAAVTLPEPTTVPTAVVGGFLGLPDAFRKPFYYVDAAVVFLDGVALSWAQAVHAPVFVVEPLEVIAALGGLGAAIIAAAHYTPTK